jgi:pyruvate dehydrogenase (quinone)
MPKVADYVLQRLTEWGIHRIFGYPGDGINGFLGALDRAKGDPEIIQPRHEEMGAFMATAHAKFTGHIGCCMAALLFRDVSEFVETCMHPAQARQLIDRACKVALSRRGVATIIFPEDVQGRCQLVGR